MPASPLPGHEAFSAEEMQRRIARQTAQAPYIAALELHFAELQPGYARLELPYREALTHSGGVMQGGIITTLADAAIAHAAIAALDSDTHRTTSIELKINFIRPARGTRFVAEARIVHMGSRTAVGEAEVLDDRGKPVARCLSTLMLLAPAAPAAGAGAGTADEEGEPGA